MKKYLKNVAYILSLFFLIKVISEIKIETFQELLNLNKFNIFFSIVLLTLSQLLIGLSWSNFLNKNYNVKKKISFDLWLNSISAKYLPGKIASPILRIEDNIFKGYKFELYNHMLTETIILILINIVIGSYIFYKNIFNYLTFFLIVNIFFSILFRLNKIEFKKFKLSYLKNIFYLELSSILSFLGIYFFIKAFNLPNDFDLSLIYIFVSGLSMLVFIVPAGIGIRESLFIEIGNSNSINTSLLASIGILLRVLNILVDLIFVIISLRALKNKKI